MPGKKILIADDDPSILELLTTRLNASGFEVCSARNGEEALAKVRSEKPLLIIMDVMMPRTSGYEAMQKIRQDPATQNIPAIVFSAKGGMKDFFLDMSNVEFMRKPFDLTSLVDRVNALLGISHGATARPKHVILAGVEDLVVNKIKDLLLRHNFQVLVVLNEAEAVTLSKKFQPDMIFCQLWEDDKILDPCKISQELLLDPTVSKTPFYVYCKEALGLQAMKNFKQERIITYREGSDLLKKLEDVLK